MKVLTFILFSVGVLVITMCISILKQMYNAKRKYKEEYARQEEMERESKKVFSEKNGEYVNYEEI